MDNLGFTFVEVLSSCPTNWNMGTIDALNRVKNEMVPFFPLGIFKERKMSDVF